MGTYDKGKAFEQRVAAMIRRKVDPTAKRNNGSHANWNRRSDIFTSLPFHIEAKDHETLKPKEWFRQAANAASFSQVPIVAFHSDEEVMAMLRLDDLLNFLVEIADLKAEVEDLQQPAQQVTSNSAEPAHIAKTAADTVAQLQRIADRAHRSCREGHIADEYGKCQWKGCKFSRGYRAPKKKDVEAKV